MGIETIMTGGWPELCGDTQLQELRRLRLRRLRSPAIFLGRIPARLPSGVPNVQFECRRMLPTTNYGLRRGALTLGVVCLGVCRCP